MNPPFDQLQPDGGWQCGVTQLQPLKVSELGPGWRALLALARPFVARRTGLAMVPDIFLVLLRHPVLFRAWLRFAAKLMPHGRLPRQDAEQVILRVAWRSRCHYEWAQHVLLGLREGLNQDDIVQLTQDASRESPATKIALLKQAVDEWFDDGQISPSCWQALSQFYQQRDLIELSLLIGHYQMLAGFINSIGLQPEPEVLAHISRLPAVDAEHSKKTTRVLKS